MWFSESRKTQLSGLKWNFPNVKKEISGVEQFSENGNYQLSGLKWFSENGKKQLSALEWNFPNGKKQKSALKRFSENGNYQLNGLI